MTIIDHLGKRVRFRPAFTELDTLEGVFVAYAASPQAIIRMDDGSQKTVDARLLLSVEKVEWEPL